MFTLAELLHSTFRQIGTIICDDTVWKTKPENHFLDELNRGGRITLANRLCLHPFCNLINRHQEVGLLVLGPFERPDHIQPPGCKRPSNWNHPQFLSRNMSTSRNFLATITSSDQIFRISMGS